MKAPERVVLGLDDARDVHAWLGVACAELLGQPMQRVVWSAGRLAAVWRLELAGGGQVVLKARRPAPGLHARLLAAVRLQQVLRARGRSLPAVVVRPVMHAGLVVTVEHLLEGPGIELARSSLTRVSARELSALVDALAGEPVPAVLMQPAPWCDSDRASRGGALWPVPHDTSVFGTSFGDVPSAVRDQAKASAELLQPLWRSPSRVLAHDDWEAQNLRMTADPDRVVAIYDSDSLAALPEVVAVGTAAAVHLAGSSYGAAAAPDDVELFLQEYESLRDALDGAAVRAAAGWAIAYNAACDVALAQSGPGSFLAACLRHREQYLS